MRRARCGRNRVNTARKAPGAGTAVEDIELCKSECFVVTAVSVVGTGV
jgi:hypothetical protein